jgi:Sodium:sulfate symporter transmembrane region
MEGDEFRLPEALQRLVRLPVDEENPECGFHRGERSGDSHQRAAFPRRRDRCGEREGEADGSDESGGIRKQDGERSEEGKTPEKARRRLRETGQGRRNEDEREERVRRVRFRPDGVDGKGRVQGEENRGEDAAGDVARPPPDEPRSKGNESERRREREQLNRELRPRQETARDCEKDHESDGMMRLDRQQVGKGGVPREERHPGVVEIERGRGEPRQPQGEGEKNDRTDRPPKEGSLPPVRGRSGPQGRVAVPGPFGCQHGEYGTGLRVALRALSGFSNGTVWLIFGAFMFALGYEKSGLGRRLALSLVKRMGRRSLGLGYAVALSDVVLAPFTPSNTARSGGTIFPVIRNISRCSCATRSGSWAS